MADDFQDKTEDASSKKLSDSRRKGMVAQSRDFTSGTLLLTSVLLLYFFSSFMFDYLQQITVGVLTHLDEPFSEVEAITYWLRQGLLTNLAMMAPFLGPLLIIGVGINVYQVGFVVSTEGITPKWNKLNIFDVNNLKKYFSLQAWMRLVLGLIKMTIIAVISYVMITNSYVQFMELMEAPVRQMFAYICNEFFWLAVVLSILLLVLGIVDFTFQKWKFMQDMKMTKQEVKEEHRQSEGDPKVKSKMRSMMQSMLSNRMKANIPKADVIIANPVHFAIAIKYDAEKMAAPICVAKGVENMAIMIKELAKEHKVPIVENPPLARALYKVVDVGVAIPANFYHAVAEVLAYVYRLNDKLGKQHARPENPSHKI
ncbi:MAG: flagellar biosynthetic protein FlhB [Chlamydiales bacterium]|jgi:flagellar biosynthetic protein FlhB|nr:flagellar biosynthetic protein FlhB [Chlamydiales bacterium]